MRSVSSANGSTTMLLAVWFLTVLWHIHAMEHMSDTGLTHTHTQKKRSHTHELWVTWSLRLRVGVSAMYAAFCDSLRLEFLSLGDW